MARSFEEFNTHRSTNPFSEPRSLVYSTNIVRELEHIPEPFFKKLSTMIAAVTSELFEVIVEVLECFDFDSVELLDRNLDFLDLDSTTSVSGDEFLISHHCGR